MNILVLTSAIKCIYTYNIQRCAYNSNYFSLPALQNPKNTYSSIVYRNILNVERLSDIVFFPENRFILCINLKNNFLKKSYTQRVVVRCFLNL